MTTDFRALCAELLEDVRYLADCVRDGDCDPVVLNDCLDHAANARAALSAPEQGPTDEELMTAYWQGAGLDGAGTGDHILRGLRAVLTRWGRPAVEPVPQEMTDG